jgi:hypothetical protein
VKVCKRRAVRLGESPHHLERRLLFTGGQERMPCRLVALEIKSQAGLNAARARGARYGFPFDFPHAKYTVN